MIRISLYSSKADRPTPIVIWAFWILVVLYAVAIMYRPAFNIIDDHKFLYSVRLGRPVPKFIDIGQARFSPLLGQEYYLFSFVSSSATAFYAGNVAELLAVAWLLVTTGRMAATRHPDLPYVITTFILLSPGFADSWFRLWVQEKNELLLLSGFFFCYLRFRKRGKIATALFGLCWAELALYTKESAFVVIAMFGLYGLIFDREPEVLTSDKKHKWRGFHLLLLMSSALFLALYFQLVYRYRGAHTYLSRPGSWISNHVTALGASLIHEPILILGLITFATVLLRSRSHLRVAAPAQTALFASVALICAYAVLGLSNVYYLLPAYFGIPYLATEFFELKSLSEPTKKPWIIALFSLLFLNQLAVAYQQFTVWRIGADDFQEMLPQLDAQLRNDAKRTRLFLDGVDVGQGGELYGSLNTYLNSRGLSSKQYDLLTDIPADESSRFVSFYPSELSFTSGSQTAKTGDFLLVTPADPYEQRQKLSDTCQYQLIFKTRSNSYRNLTLKQVLRRVLGLPAGADSFVNPNYELYKKLSDH